jgi:hypothetical protein
MGVGGQRAEAKPMEEGRPLLWEEGRIKADKSLRWTETVNPRNIPDMDACPNFF